MNKSFNLDSIKIYLSKTAFKLRKFLQECWPINWSNFKKPKLVFVSFFDSPYPVKAFFLLCSLGLMISIYFLSFGTYLAFTKEVAGSGGEVREATLNADLKNFNPVLQPNSEAEKKINSLLYHPLYTVSFPNFLQESTSQPEIKPVLIKGNPEWQDLNEKSPDNRYKVLKFILNSDLKWSNGKAITLSDLEYTFDRLKEPGSNSQFKDIFSKVEFARITEKEFQLRSTVSSPQLIYLANFSPISKEFYENKNLETLSTDFRSSKPTVTSGYFTFNNDQFKDPDKSDGPLRDNPIRSENKGGFSSVILVRSPIQNTKETVYLDRYILKNYENLFDSGGKEVLSLERAASASKLDIFSRQLGPNTNLDSSETQKKLGLEQSLIPTNTFYNVYLNIRRNDVFLNQSLRKYLVCNLISYELNKTSKTYPGLDNIEKSKRLIPLQFNQSQDPGCPANPKDILDGKTYKLNEDSKTGVKRVQVCGRRCSDVAKLTLIGFADTDPLLTEIQNLLLDIGMPANLVKEPSEVDSRLQKKDYSLAFLPTTMLSRDPYSLYGARGRDISQIRLNNVKSIVDAKIEDALNTYSLSNLQDADSRNKLVEFFAKEYVSVNLFQAKSEINFSKRVNNLSDFIPGFTTFNEDLYSKIPSWYIDTKRELK